jgi:hypothetical protein
VNSTNRFGLNRHIPHDVKRVVRQECGFGCVICGATIVEYEHFLPDFTDAQEHDPKRIALLCPNHHASATKGLLPKHKVKEARAAPFAKRAGFSTFNHPYFQGIPNLRIGGGAVIENTPVPIRVKGVDLIRFDAAEDGSGVCRISANLFDTSGKTALSVSENEWRVHNHIFDFENIGNRYIFRDMQKKVILCLRMEAQHGLIAIEKLSSIIDGVLVVADEQKLSVNRSTFSGCMASNCAVGFDFG